MSPWRKGNVVAIDRFLRAGCSCSTGADPLSKERFSTNENFYKQRALEVRDLAAKAAPFIKQRLLDSADRYDGQRRTSVTPLASAPAARGIARPAIATATQALVRAPFQPGAALVRFRICNRNRFKFSRLALRLLGCDGQAEIRCH